MLSPWSKTHTTSVFLISSNVICLSLVHSPSSPQCTLDALFRTDLVVFTRLYCLIYSADCHSTACVLENYVDVSPISCLVHCVICRERKTMPNRDALTLIKIVVPSTISIPKSGVLFGVFDETKIHHQNIWIARVLVSVVFSDLSSRSDSLFDPCPKQTTYWSRVFSS